MRFLEYKQLASSNFVLGVSYDMKNFGPTRYFLASIPMQANPQSTLMCVLITACVYRDKRIGYRIA